MQLSSYARKAAAVGLTASTLLWAAGLGFIPTVASAQVHSDGCLVLSGGVVWLITNGTRRGFTSAPVFQSWGYNFSEVVPATAEDVALPVGPIMTYADGTLVMDPSLSPLVYLVTGGQKRGFVSGDVFTGLGFSFANIETAPANTFNDLPTGANLDTTSLSAAHPAGVLVNANGTIWLNTATGWMGIPSMAVFQSYGYNLSNVVTANAADLALTNQGAVTARPGCTGGDTGVTPPSGSASVTLASDNPVANTVILGQATADMLHLNFSGSGAVTQVTLQRLGVSSNDLLANVYLYDGGLRITDGSAVNSNGQIVFSNSSGLFNAPAEISVRADIETSGAGGSTGQTVGLAFVSGESGTNAITGTASGNLFTTADPGNVATAVFSANQVSGSNVNAGSLNYSIWRAPVAISNRTVWLSSFMLKAIGSAPTDAFQNYIMYVDGNQVAMASGLTAVNGSNYVVFTLSTPFSLTTGSHLLEVRADVIKGSDRDMTFSLNNAADIVLTDSSFNVNITPTGIVPNASGDLQIQLGFVSVQLDPSFSSVTNITGGSTNVTLGKFIFTGYGEDTQINNLVVDVTDGSGAPLSNGLNNVALYVNGAQVGSNKQLANPDTTVTFSLGSSFIVAAGTTDNVSITADTIDHSNATITSGTVKVALITGHQTAGNAQGRSSQETFTVPAGNVTSPALTIGAAGLTVAENASYTNQTLPLNASAQRIGSFTLQAGNSEGVQVSNLSVNLTDGSNAALTNNGTPPLTNFSNLRVSVNGGTPSTPLPPQATNNNFSQNFTIAPNTTATVDVWADLGSSTGTMKTTLTVTGSGATSHTSITGTAVIGQTITLASGTLTNPPTFTPAQSSSSQFISSATGATDASLNSFNLAATSGPVNVSELKVAVVGTAGSVASVKIGTLSAPVVTPAATTVGTGGVADGTTNVALPVTTSANMSVGSLLKIDSEYFVVTSIDTTTEVNVDRNLLGGGNAAHTATTAITIEGMADLTGLSIAVPNGSGGAYINALPTYATVGTNGIASGSTAQLALTYAKYTTGSSSTPIAIDAAAANTMNLVASAPTLTATTNSGVALQVGENHVFDLTVTPSSQGNTEINRIVFSYSKSGGVTTVSSARIAVGNTTITASSCSVDSPSSGMISCSLPGGYVLTAGVPQTISLFATITSSGGLGSAGTSSLTVALQPLSSSTATNDFQWTDVAGSNTAFDTANFTYLNNFPTATWSAHN